MEILHGILLWRLLPISLSLCLVGLHPPTADDHSCVFFLHCCLSTDISFSWMYLYPVQSSVSFALITFLPYFLLVQSLLAVWYFPLQHDQSTVALTWPLWPWVLFPHQLLQGIDLFVLCPPWNSQHFSPTPHFQGLSSIFVPIRHWKSHEVAPWYHAVQSQLYHDHMGLGLPWQLWGNPMGFYNTAVTESNIIQCITMNFPADTMVLTWWIHGDRHGKIPWNQFPWSRGFKMPLFSHGKIPRNQLP